MDYEEFVSRKLTRDPPTGIACEVETHPSLFPFQHDIVRWALRRGRCAVFADTGLGKTRMQLAWADAVRRHTARKVLILAPLAVAQQTAAEGRDMGMIVTVCRDASDVQHGINVTNYDRLHRFDTAAFGAVVLDESSVIKHHDAKTLGILLEAFAGTPFKLCATATPAPNDFTELGTHAEFLGVCTRSEMLAEFFCHDGGETQKWRLKGHARVAFWRWVASWAAMVRRPSDLGYADGGYSLPPVRYVEHTVAAQLDTYRRAGFLFGAVIVGQGRGLAEPPEELSGLFRQRQAVGVAGLLDLWAAPLVPGRLITPQPVDEPMRPQVLQRPDNGIARPAQPIHDRGD